MNSSKSIAMILSLAVVLLVTGVLSTAFAGDFQAFDEGQRILGPGKTIFLPDACASDCPPPPFPPTHECLADCTSAQLTFSGEGYSPQIGKYIWTGEPIAPCCPSPNGCSNVDAKVEITTEEGTIYLETSGDNCRHDGWFSAYKGAYTVTGGTGRFEGSHGSGSLIVTVDYPEYKMLRHFNGTLTIEKIK